MKEKVLKYAVKRAIADQLMEKRSDHISQEKMAERYGLSARYYIDLEHAESCASAATLYKLFQQGFDLNRWTEDVKRIYERESEHKTEN